MPTVSEKLDSLVSILDSIPCGEYVSIDSLSRNKNDFIEAVKLLIDLGCTQYVFSNDYQKICRYDNNM